MILIKRIKIKYDNGKEISRYESPAYEVEDATWEVIRKMTHPEGTIFKLAENPIEVIDNGKIENIELEKPIEPKEITSLCETCIFKNYNKIAKNSKCYKCSSNLQSDYHIKINLYDKSNK